LCHLIHIAVHVAVLIAVFKSSASDIVLCQGIIPNKDFPALLLAPPTSTEAPRASGSTILSHDFRKLLERLKLLKK
jgi:hypothetical protein